MTFTPFLSTIGGLLLSLPVYHRARLHGRVTGVSGNIRHALTLNPSSLTFLFGLFLAGITLTPYFPLPDTLSAFPLPLTVVAGLCVGFGAALANGCTSGHALCGLARVSRRSIVATAVFMAVAAAVTNATGVELGGADVVWEGGLPRTAALILSAAVIPWLLSLVGAVVDGALAMVVDVLLEVVFGYSFGAGLMVAGMASPAKVRGFFNIGSTAWDPSLAFVFVGGLPVAFAGFHPIASGGKPTLRQNHQLPGAGTVDSRLIMGASLFGLGWGLVGVCPGPAMVYAGMWPGSWAISTFLGGVVAGVTLEKLSGLAT